MRDVRHWSYYLQSFLKSEGLPRAPKKIGQQDRPIENVVEALFPSERQTFVWNFLRYIAGLLNLPANHPGKLAIFAAGRALRKFKLKLSTDNLGDVLGAAMLAVVKCSTKFNPDLGWSHGTYAWNAIARACHEEVLWLIDGKHLKKGSRAFFVNDDGNKVKGYRLFGPSVSLDEQLGDPDDEGAPTFHDLITSSDEEDLLFEVRDLVAKDRRLDKRERRVVLDRIDGASNVDIAKREELSGGRITQIWNEATAKLAAKINTKRNFRIEELAEFYVRTTPKTGGPKADPKPTSTAPDSHSFPSKIRYVADMSPEELRASERHRKEACKRMPKPNSNVGCECFASPFKETHGPWIEWIRRCDALFPNLNTEPPVKVFVAKKTKKDAFLADEHRRTKQISFVAAAHRRAYEIRRTASEHNVIAMLEGRKVQVPRRKIYPDDDYSPYERLQHQCEAIKAANRNIGRWRKPRIGIHTYPKGTTQKDYDYGRPSPKHSQVRRARSADSARGPRRNRECGEGKVRAALGLHALSSPPPLGTGRNMPS